MGDRIDVSVSVARSKSRMLSITIALVGVFLSTGVGFFIANTSSTLKVLAVMVGMIAFVATFIRIDLGVQVVIFILYSQTYIIIGERYGLPDLAKIFILLLLVAMAIRWVVYQNEIPAGWGKPLMLIALYCTIGLGSVLYATDPGVSQPIAKELMKSGVIALIIALVVRTEQTFRQVMWVLLLVGIFLGGLSIYQFITGSYGNDYGGFALSAVQNIIGETNDYRAGGPVGDPNFYAQMMLVLVPIALDRFWNETSRFLKILALSAMLACSFTIFLTYSRGGFISLIIILVTMLAIFHRDQLQYLFVAVFIAALLMRVLPSRFTDRIETLTDLIPTSSSDTAISKDYSFRGRTSEMIVALRMFADHPILGVGLGNYSVRYQEYSRRLGLDLRSEVRQAHSLYLEVAAETGLLGIFSFGMILWVLLSSMWKAYRSLARVGLTSLSDMVAAYTFGFVGYLMAALFIHNAYPRNFWVLAGIAFAIPRMVEIEIKKNETLKNKAYYTKLFNGASDAS